MHHHTLTTCCPWFALFSASCVLLWILARASHATGDYRRLLRLHRDEVGSVQALSFVLTFPVFVWVMMLIVQVSQLMIGSIVIHYAAFAAARAAVVWIPARLDNEEENTIAGGYAIARSVVDSQADTPIVLDEQSPDFGPRDGWLTYHLNCGDPLRPTSGKARIITRAAVMAIAPICPSSPDAGQQRGTWNETADDVANAFQGVAGATATSPTGIQLRLRNKLAYAAEHTRLRLYFRHPNGEPPLKAWNIGPTASDWEEFRATEAEYGTELGFQDQVTVTLSHDFALLPGPGRLLARFAKSDDPLAESLRGQRAGSRYFIPLTASATLGIEGEKPVKRYDQTD
jgi:hypothetical protein